MRLKARYGLPCASTCWWRSRKRNSASSVRSTRFYRFLRSICLRKSPFHRWLRKLLSEILTPLTTTKWTYSVVNRTVVLYNILLPKKGGPNRASSLNCKTLFKSFIEVYLFSRPSKSDIASFGGISTTKCTWLGGANHRFFTQCQV